MTKSALLCMIFCILTIQISAQTKNHKKVKEAAALAMKPSNISLSKLIQDKNNTYVVTKEHVSSISGVRHVYLRQAIDGLEVSGTESSVHFDKTGAVIMEHNKFLMNVQASIKNSYQGISARQAVASVAGQMGYPIANLTEINKIGGINKATVFNKANISSENIPVKLMYYYREGLGTYLVWELSVAEKTSSDWWNFRVDAATGKIIDKDNWTVSCNILGDHEDHLQVQSDKTDFIGPNAEPITNNSRGASNIAPPPAASYRVYAMPIENPNYGVRTLVANPENLVASPFGWHDANGVDGAEFTNTRGNNTDTYDDDNSNNNPDNKYAFSPGGNLIFDFPLNTTYSSGDQSEDAALTNLFYWTNIIHDVTYQYGFDEASGNFQHNNYGNGGLGNDPVNAEAQDGGGSCNANFATPGDGSRPRMQMYVCGSRDGDLDNMVIIHEYAHGISNRLSILSGQEQMGEGWSDYYGLMLTMQSGDAGPDSRGVGTWLFGQGPGGPGIRTYPYSTDFVVNPHTYDDIKTAVAPHGVGSVWAEMLWEMTWELIAIHGFDTDFYNGVGGNNISLALVTEGLKLQPSQPGFVDGRDAILAADMAMYGGANQCAIWDAFARRGLGYSAIQGSSASKTDGTEAFDLPPSLASLNVVDEVCLSDGIQTGLSGGFPSGGVYSGSGVTDDANGTTFTFDPSIGGPGLVTVSYLVNEPCTGMPTTVTDDINVTNEPPEINCMGSGIIPMTDSQTSSPSAGIPDNDPTGVTVTMNVTEDVTITDLDVNLNISHTWVGDLIVTIKSPGGTTATIVDRPSNCSGDDIVATLDDEAPTAVEDECAGSVPTINGSFQPNNPLSIFDGESTMGLWELTVSDVEGLDTGTINSWGIDYDYEVTAPVLDVTLDGSGNAIVNAEDLLFSVSVECGSYTVLAGSPLATTVSFTCSDLGLNNVTVEVTNDNGAITTCSATVNVMDSGAGAPFICPGDITQNNDVGICGAVVTYSVDAPPSCSGSICITEDFETYIPPSGGAESLGTNVLDETTIANGQGPGLVEDGCVYMSSGNIQWNNAGYFGQLNRNINAANNTLILEYDTTVNAVDFNLSAYSVFSDTATIEAFDTGGSSLGVVGPLTISDATPVPVSFSIPGIKTIVIVGSRPWSPLINDHEFCSAGSGSGTITQTGGLPSGATFPVGTTTNTFEYDDGVNPVQTCSFDVTVNDTENPVITCPADISQDSDPGDCGAIVNFAATATDNCSAVVTYSQNPGTFFSVGTTTVTATATDPSGNSASCDFEITVNDTEDPIITCPADITQDNDPGDCGAIVTFAATATDNCSAVVTYSQNPDTYFPVGTTTVTATATDPSGNSASCDFDITVNDTEDPDIVCMDITVALDAAGNATVLPGDVDGGSSDNCGIVTSSVFPNTFTCDDIGDNAVTFKVTDASGNSSICGVTVTIIDDIPPTIACPSDLVMTADPGACGTNVTFADALALDNCDVTVSQTDGGASGSFFPVGVTTIEFTATDAGGNMTTCSFTITITDDEDPVAVCQDITVQLDATGSVTITPGDIDDGSSDNCGIDSSSLDIDTFDCSNVGANTVTLTITDDSGNISTCTATVTVEDVEAPTIVCQDITVELDANGMVTVNANDLVDTSADNCGPITITSGSGAIINECGDNVGAFIDDANPVDSVATVTDTGIIGTDVYLDTVILDITHTFDGDLELTLVSPMGTTLDLSSDNGGAGDNYTNTVFQDGNPSITTGSAPFTGSFQAEGGTFAATFDGEDIAGDWTLMIFDDAGGDEGTFNSFCMNFVSLTATMIDFDCDDLGINEVTITATDASGNTASCTAMVTVEDNLAPVLVCQSATITITEDGTATVDPLLLLDMTNPLDNCAIDALATDAGVLDCSDVGTTITVTVFATDTSGNISSCTTTIDVVDMVGPVYDQGTLPGDQVRDPGPDGIYILEDFTQGVTAQDNCSESAQAIVIDQNPAPGTPLGVGVYDITLSAVDDLGNMTDYVFELIINPIMGIEENTLVGLVLYPNPAQDVVVLSNPQGANINSLSIYDLTGRLISTHNLINMGAEKTIDVSQLQSATYMVLIQGEGGLVTKQLVKE